MNDALRFPAPDSDVQDIELDDEQMLVLDARAGTRVRVLEGSLWLTEKGQSVARLLRPREEMNLAATGQVVLESAGSTRIEFVRPAPPRARWLSGRVGHGFGFSAGRLVQGFALALGIAAGAGVPELLARGFQKSSGDSFVAAAGAHRSSPVRL